MRTAIATLVLALSAICAPPPEAVLLIADAPDFLSATQRQEAARRGWPVTQSSVAEALRQKLVPSGTSGPVVVYGATAPRRVVPVKTGADVLRLLASIDSGHQTFQFACTRCHGEDGNSDGYFNIRKLGGIGSRLTTAQITERLRLVPMGNSDFSVRGHIVTREQLDALIVYVAGL